MTVIFDIPSSFNELFDSSLIKNSVTAAIKHQGISSASDLTIVLVDDPRMQELNREFRQVDRTTDVLAFPAGHEDPDSQHTYLGDVIISLPQAKLQADQSKHSLNNELQLLAIHGVLHLIGHDHLEPEDKAKMWSAQEQILNQRGLYLSLPE
jgi:probable rRNA maturation factor